MAHETETAPAPALRTDYRRPEGVSLDALEFARQMIEGPGGANDYQLRHGTTWDLHDRVVGAMWMLECLADIDCEGSDMVVSMILVRRARDRTARDARARS